jgi:hypothetical protein
MGLRLLLATTNILEEQKTFLRQEQEKIWAMDGKQEEVEEKISIGLFLNVLLLAKLTKSRLTLITSKEITQINVLYKLHI